MEKKKNTQHIKIIFIYIIIDKINIKYNFEDSF